MKELKLITEQQIIPENFQHAKEMRREMTPAEGKLWAYLRNNRLEGFHFRRQQCIGPYIVDFLCNPCRLVVEVDGDVHLGQEGYDRQRDRDLEDLGLRVLHFWNDDINQNMDEVLEEVLKACQTAGSQPLPDPHSGGRGEHAEEPGRV